MKPRHWLLLSKTRRRGRHKSRRTRRHDRLIELLWPSMGMRPWVRWLALTLMRQADRPHAVALGFSIGAWVAFNPVFGTHLILSFILCLLLRGSYLSAVAGTFIGNPWTYGPMWWSGYEMGRRLLGTPKVNIRALLEGQLTFDLFWSNAQTLLHDVLIPALLGGALVGLPVAVLCYGLIYWQVLAWRRRRVRRMKERAQLKLAQRRLDEEATR